MERSLDCDVFIIINPQVNVYYLDSVLFKIISVTLFIIWCMWDKKVIENIKMWVEEYVYNACKILFFKKIDFQIARKCVRGWGKFIGFIFLYMCVCLARKFKKFLAFYVR